MLYEIHMLKNYPPTNLNRDDTGAAKTCVFGGVTRGRISSQCLKYSWRESWKKSGLFYNENEKEKIELGYRTRSLPDLVYDRLPVDLLTSLKVKDAQGEDIEENACKIFAMISGIGNKDGKANDKPHQTAQIIFYSEEDINKLTNAVKEQLEKWEKDKIEIKNLNKDKLQDASKELQSSLKKQKEEVDSRPVTGDIALFGRMVTSDAMRNVDASIQVAHAISTNEIIREADYFTAMDDLISGDVTEESGAAMIESTDYNSSCYYIYASLDSDVLRKNLNGVEKEKADEIVKTIIPAVLHAMTFTNPSGKQNSFAGNILPSAILVDCKTENNKIPTSMVNAFVKPVRPHDEKDLVECSIERLSEEANSISKNYGLPVKKRIWFCADKYRDVVKPTSISKGEEIIVEPQICDSVDDIFELVKETFGEGV